MFARSVALRMIASAVAVLADGPIRRPATPGSEAVMDAGVRAHPVDPAVDPRVRERFAALDRVQVARRALEAERERTADLIDELAFHERDPDEIGHLREIHESLEQERRAARRPFGRRNGREILSLELAERLVLARLGYIDYAEYAAAQERSDRLVIDLVELGRLEAELSAALADLARLPVGGDVETAAPLPRRTRPSPAVLPSRLEGRATATRKEVFGSSTGWAPDRRSRAANPG